MQCKILTGKFEFETIRQNFTIQKFPSGAIHNRNLQTLHYILLGF